MLFSSSIFSLISIEAFVSIIHRIPILVHITIINFESQNVVFYIRQRQFHVMTVTISSFSKITIKTTFVIIINYNVQLLNSFRIKKWLSFWQPRNNELHRWLFNYINSGFLCFLNIEFSQFFHTVNHRNTWICWWHIFISVKLNRGFISCLLF